MKCFLQMYIQQEVYREFTRTCYEREKKDDEEGGCRERSRRARIILWIEWWMCWPIGGGRRANGQGLDCTVQYPEQSTPLEPSGRALRGLELRGRGRMTKDMVMAPKVAFD